MSISSCYQSLNLKEGASLGEIKSAFRNLAKVYHPDAAGKTSADTDKFIKAQTAYKKLLQKAVAHNQTRQAQQSETQAPHKTTALRNYYMENSREIGLDIHYNLQILRPSTGGLKIVLPWQVREACPRCLGQGKTLTLVGKTSLYRPHTCSKCGGSGNIARLSQLETSIAENMVGQTKIRLKKAGLYNPKEATRGDLFLNITWVDRLPTAH